MTTPRIGEVREAVPADNVALLALTAACPMEGDIGLCVERAPDFFALNALEGESWRVGVVDDADGVPIGCVAVAERLAYVRGEATRTMYVSDLKVLPAYRGTAAADALVAYARDVCAERGGDDVLVFLTILAGNEAMRRRLSGPRGLPQVDRIATIRSHSIPLLWRRRAPVSAELTVSPATSGDLAHMAALWTQVAPRRQFAAVLDETTLLSWIEAAPDLDVSSYLLARDASGAIVGFLGVWDQHGFKQLRITGYSRRLAAVRALFNAAGPLTGAAPLPPPGSALRFVTAVNVCVAPERPEVLRALVLRAYDGVRGRDYSFLNIGLDVADPAATALKGLLAQPTDVWACISSPRGAYAGPDVADRPVHHEIALV
ncbi:MAG TPA: GNAT family N-acetyltransferase [Mycobacteriales bacterium]|nr:GNAT family N-acetyltransferase [Mycobacteriales bacterium]